MSKLSRFLLGTVLALSLAICGLPLGTWVGGNYFVGPGQGLAGPIEALAYGVFAAVAFLVIGIILAFVMRAILLKILAVVAFVPAVIVVFVVGQGVLVNQAEMDDALNEQIVNLPPFTLQLSQSDGVAGRHFADVAFDSNRNSYTVTLPDGDACSGPLPAASKDKVTLLTAIRNVEILLAQQPVPCAEGGVVTHGLTFQIEEAMPPNTAGSVAITEACLSDHDALHELVSTVNEVYVSNQDLQSCG